MKTWYTVIIHNIVGRQFPIYYEHYGSLASAKEFTWLLLTRHDGPQMYATIDNEQGNQVATLSVS